MAKVVQAADFFVVGGPVQPDRACYVVRLADLQLAAAINQREYCCVLGPLGTGKTSLMLRAARAARQAGGLAATVDLAQLASRAGDAEQGAEGFVHRVAHDLHLQLDVAAWWGEHAATPPRRRIADFFWEIVLTNTTAPITVFVDDIELALSQPFGQEVLAGVDGCRVRRVRESDYRRVSFVLLGVLSPERLAAASPGPMPFELRSIDLADFAVDEAYELAAGFGGHREQSRALIDRICVWTNGYPYLTQKVARGVARKGGKLEDVERVVREQLLAPAALGDDPLLSHARSLLAARTPAARRALKSLRRVVKGAAVPAPADLAVREVLEQSGVVAREANGVLRARNRVTREVFGPRWIKSVAPAGWRIAGAVAVVVALVAIGVYAYFNHLPVSYERTLTSAESEWGDLDAAHLALRRLPGFVERADQLLLDALRQRSERASDVAELRAADTRLRALPGQTELADRLLADFWLRRTAAAAAGEQRDASLLLALRAAAGARGDEAGEARAWVQELAGRDYPLLESTTPLIAAAPPTWWVDWQSSPALLAITSELGITRVPLTAETQSPATVSRITALRHTVLERDLVVEGEGSAGELELNVALAHDASGELSLTLTAPSGARATLLLPRSIAASSESYVFTAQQGTPLASLADEERRGTWKLALVDRRVGNTGTLGGWGLRFGEEGWRDDPPEGVSIPDPERTESVTLDTSAAAPFALAQPAERGAVGSVSLWNIAARRLDADFTLPAPPRDVAVNAAGTRLLAATASALTLLSTVDGAVIASLSTETEFVLPPIFSSDGGYVAMAERVDGSQPLYSVLRADDGSLLASIDGRERVERWWLGPGARYFALLGPSNVLRIVDARGAELARLQHASAITRVLPLPDGATLISVDDAGEIRAWDIAAGDGVGRSLGTARAVDGVSVAANGVRVAYPSASNEVVVRDVATGVRLHTLETDVGGSALPRISPDGSRLVTLGDERVRVWSLPATPPAPSPAPAVAAARSTPDLDVTALAIDSQGIAIGSRSGELRSGANADSLSAMGLDFFGHRGAITALAIDSTRAVAVTGGVDGIVRVWNLATGEPVTPVIAHSVARNSRPIVAVALSADGRWIASASAGVVKLWSAADGASVRDLPFAGATATLAFAPAASLLAIGDASSLTLTPLMLSGRDDVRSQSVGAALAGIAFAPSGEHYASADVAGNLQLRGVATNATVGEARKLPSAVRWIGFGDDRTLLAATDGWLHSFAITPSGLEPLHSRRLNFVSAPTAAFSAAGGERARIAGFDAFGALQVLDIDLAAAPDASAAAPPEMLQRAWPAALGVELDDAGELDLPAR